MSALLLVVAHAGPVVAQPSDPPVAEVTLSQPASSTVGTAAVPSSRELMDLERLADEAFAQDDLDTALALYRQLADRHPQTAGKTRATMTIAWLEHLRGNRVPTLLALTEVLVLDPDYELQPQLYSDEFVPLFYEARERAIQTRQADSSRLIREGIEYLRQRQTAPARERFERALAIWPDQPRALYNLALADYYDQRLDDALAGFQKLLSLAAAKPGQVDAEVRGQALTNQGLIYLDQGLPADAAEVLERAVQVLPESGPAWSNLGVAQRRAGQSGRAIEAFRRASQLDPSDVDTARNLALAHLDAGDPPAAAALLRETTARFADDAGLWLYFGLALDRQGQLQGARDSYEQALARDPANRQGWAASAALQLAALTFAQNDLRSCLAHATRVVEWRPEEVNGWVYQGLARHGLGDLDSALESLVEARRLDPTRADIHNSLGSVFFGLGRLDEAEAAFRRALDLQPDLRTARDNLASVGAVRSGKAVRGDSSGRSAARAGSGSRATAARPEPTRPSLGVRFADVDYASLGLEGAMVEKVFPETAAARAGLAENDLLLRMDGRTITSGRALEAYIVSKARGAEVVIELLRANRPVSLRLTVP